MKLNYKVIIEQLLRRLLCEIEKVIHCTKFSTRIQLKHLQVPFFPSFHNARVHLKIAIDFVIYELNYCFPLRFFLSSKICYQLSAIMALLEKLFFLNYYSREREAIQQISLFA